MWHSEIMGWSSTAFLLDLLSHTGSPASLSILDTSKQVWKPKFCDLQIQGTTARVSQAVPYSPIGAMGKGLNFQHHQAHEKHEVGLGRYKAT